MPERRLISEVFRRRKRHKDFNTLNGKSNIAPIILKTTSSVKPTIRKGRSINHTIGKTNNTINANGQHRVKRMQISTSKIKVLMLYNLCTVLQITLQVKNAI